MIELGAPAWLAGLVLVPLMRLLHQLQGTDQVRMVPAAFLWPRGPASDTTGPRLRPPDPVWRRRAVIAALLALTLADPSWPTGGPPTVEVLVDDRPSLLVREADGSRRADQAALALRQALAPGQPPRVRLIPVGGTRPAAVVDLTDGVASAAALARLADAQPDAEPGAEPDAAPDTVDAPGPGAAGARRWLVSDGSGGTDRLAGLGPFERVLAVGTLTENQGIIRLAARPVLDQPGLLVLLVTLTNPGRQPGERTLSLAVGGRTLVQTPLRLPAGASVTQTWQLPWERAGDTPAGGPDRSAPVITATLAPADALAADDRMTLDLAPLVPVALVLPADCPRSVAAAISAHPGLRPAADTDPPGTPPLRLWCGPSAPPAGAAPTLWFPPGTPIAAEGPARWLPPVDDGPAPGRLNPIVVQPAPDGAVLLAAGTTPLIIEQTNPRRLIGLFDTSDAPTTDTSAVPLLLDWMSARLLGRELLDPTAATARPPAEVRIAPGPVPAAAPSPAPGSAAHAGVPLWTLPLIGALLLLGRDLHQGGGPGTGAHPGWRRRPPAPPAATPIPDQDPA